MRSLSFLFTLMVFSAYPFIDSAIADLETKDLDCSLKKNFVEYPLTETTIVDEEEESESYEALIDGIKVDVLYLPFQEGIYLNLTHKERNISVEAIGRQEVGLSYTSGESQYDLFCTVEE